MNPMRNWCGYLSFKLEVFLFSLFLLSCPHTSEMFLHIHRRNSRRLFAPINLAILDEKNINKKETGNFETLKINLCEHIYDFVVGTQAREC